MLEVLITIAAVAVLVMLTLPSISRARSAAALTGSLSNIRQHLNIFALYNSDFDLHMPYYTRPDGLVWLDAGSIRVWAGYFTGYALWNLALAPIYYEGRWSDPSFLPPGCLEAECAPGVMPVVSEYFYSSTFLADPAYWTYDRREGPHQWRATRAQEVTHPSKKGVLFEAWPYARHFASGMAIRCHDSPAIGFADGSARRYHTTKILPGHARGVGLDDPYSMGSDYPTMHTIRGVRGRDVE